MQDSNHLDTQIHVRVILKIFYLFIYSPFFPLSLLLLQYNFASSICISHFYHFEIKYNIECEELKQKHEYVPSECSEIQLEEVSYELS